MSTLHNKLQASPLLARVLPFVVFLVLTSAQGSFGPDSQFWVYLLKTLVGVWMIWTIWPLVGEMRWALSIEAVVGGLLVFLLWIGLDFPYHGRKYPCGIYLLTRMLMMDCPFLPEISGLVQNVGHLHRYHE